MQTLKDPATTDTKDPKNLVHLARYGQLVAYCGYRGTRDLGIWSGESTDICPECLWKARQRKK